MSDAGEAFFRLFAVVPWPLLTLLALVLLGVSRWVVHQRKQQAAYHQRRLRVEMVRHRVLRGMRLLDSARPGWAQQVDWDHLEMVHCDRCVLAQVYGSYDRGLRELRLGPFEAEELGFMVHSSDPDWTVLDEAWPLVARERDLVREAA